MMKPLFTAVAAGAILALSACTATRYEPVKDNAQSTLQAVTVTGQELRPIATDYVTGVIAGLEKGDYQLFIRNYADEYSKTMNAANSHRWRSRFRNATANSKNWNIWAF